MTELCKLDLGGGKYLLVTLLGRAYANADMILDPRMWLFSLN